MKTKILVFLFIFALLFICGCEEKNPKTPVDEKISGIERVIMGSSGCKITFIISISESPNKHECRSFWIPNWRVVLISKDLKPEEKMWAQIKGYSRYEGEYYNLESVEIHVHSVDEIEFQ